jgi:hypothetical protein
MTALVTQDVFEIPTVPRGAKHVSLGALKPKLIINAQSLVRGRIIRMEHHVDPSYFLIALQWETVEYLGVTRPFAGKLKYSLEARSGLRAEGTIYSHAKLPGTGTFVFRSRARYVLPRGYESQWFTTVPATAPAK